MHPRPASPSRRSRSKETTTARRGDWIGRSGGKKSGWTTICGRRRRRTGRRRGTRRDVATAECIAAARTDGGDESNDNSHFWAGRQAGRQNERAFVGQRWNERPAERETSLGPRIAIVPRRPSFLRDWLRKQERASKLIIYTLVSYLTFLRPASRPASQSTVDRSISLTHDRPPLSPRLVSLRNPTKKKTTLSPLYTLSYSVRTPWMDDGSGLS